MTPRGGGPRRPCLDDAVSKTASGSAKTDSVEDGVGEDDLLVHTPHSANPAYATLLAQMTYPAFPTPFGVIRQLEGRETYEDSVTEQLTTAKANQGEGDLQELLAGSNSWVVE